MKARHLILPIGLNVCAIVMAASMTGPLWEHLSNGGSWWWTSALLIPALVGLTGIALAVRVDNVASKIRWRTYQEEEAEARRRTATVEARRAEAAAVNAMRAVGGRYLAESTAMTAAEAGQMLDETFGTTGNRRLAAELAAEHARDKRYMDGLGDQ